jgi:hypothetical protein
VLATDAGMAALAAVTGSPFWLFIEMTLESDDYEFPGKELRPKHRKCSVITEELAANRTGQPALKGRTGRIVALFD